MAADAEWVYDDAGRPTFPDDYWGDFPTAEHPVTARLVWSLPTDERVQRVLAELDRLSVPPRWRRWRVTNWLVAKAYVLGIIAGSSWCSHPAGGYVNRVNWRGRRPYLLGLMREEWRCWLVGRHRPGVHVGFGYCGKCVPWTCCGSTDVDHRAGCAEAAA